MLLREPGRGQNTGVSVVASYLAGKIGEEKVGVNGKPTAEADAIWIRLLIVESFVGTVTRQPSNPHIPIYP